jgi:hypothetical protein
MKTKMKERNDGKNMSKKTKLTEQEVAELRREAGEREVHLKFNPKEVLTVLTLAASYAKNDADRAAVVSVGKQFEAIFEVKGSSPAIGDFHSVSDFVAKNIRWLEEARRSEGTDAGEQRQLKRAQELIDEFHQQSSRAK